MTEEKAAVRGRGRPRDAEIDRRIVDAARSLLAEVRPLIDKAAGSPSTPFRR